jgi:hypothetical protein
MFIRKYCESHGISGRFWDFHLIAVSKEDNPANAAWKELSEEERGKFDELAKQGNFEEKWKIWVDQKERFTIYYAYTRNKEVNAILISFEESMKRLEVNGYMAVISIYEVKDPTKKSKGMTMTHHGSKSLNEWMARII